MTDCPCFTTKEAQLPKEMPDCTIVFKECPLGHGRLTATNWIDRGCVICEREAWIIELDAQLQAAKVQCGDEVQRLREALQIALARPWVGIESAVDRDGQQAERALKGQHASGSSGGSANHGVQS